MKNRVARPSGLFLGLGDNFRKVMMKTDLPCIPAGDLRSAADPSSAIDDSMNCGRDVRFCFRHNLFKIYFQDLQIVRNLR